MPSHVVFGETGVAAPKYQQPSTPPPPRSTTPPPIASSSTTAGLKRALPSSPPSSPTTNNNSNKKKKKARVVNFDEEEEEKLLNGKMNGHVKPGGGGGGQGGVKGKAAKMRRLEEAQRLLVGRQQLPIWQGREAIVEAIRNNPTVVILGETGSGKTTQVPQFILQSTISCSRPRLCVTQPRRVAATSLASRVASESGSILGGGIVGYTVRFDDKSSEKTRLKYMTDGALLAEMLGDRDLERYEVVVLDEAHERSLRTDMLLGFLKQVQKRREKKLLEWEEEKKGKGKEMEGEGKPTPLKIVIMSATIDAKRFSDFFDSAPVLYIKGRQHSVKVFYTQEPIMDFVDAALKTIFSIHVKRQPGDILVFLPGQEDIEKLEAAINQYLPDLQKSHKDRGNLLICPLYAKLSPTEQAKAFQLTPPNHRKVILSTNVAETSVTIPGVVFVVDSGFAKEKQYHPTVGIETLVSEPISQSSALQRTGRAGRERSGSCFRLYTEKAFLELEKTTKPEIQRVSMTFAILHLLAAGQEDVWSFDYMDRPEKSSIMGALNTLYGLGALDKGGRISPLGKQMASLPLEPVYSRVLLASFESGCTSDIIDLVSLIGARDSLLTTSTKNRDEANLARKKFHHRTGDHMMLLNILKAYEEVENNGEEKKKWCHDHWINFRAMGNVLESRKQLRERCERMKKDWRSSKVGEKGEEENTDLVLSTLVAGLFANTAILQPDGKTYRHTLTRETINIHPGSTIHQKKSPAIIYDELVFTKKAYARGVSSIHMSWLKTKAPATFGTSS